MWCIICRLFFFHPCINLIPNQLELDFPCNEGVLLQDEPSGFLRYSAFPHNFNANINFFLLHHCIPNDVSAGLVTQGVPTPFVSECFVSIQQNVWTLLQQLFKASSNSNAAGNMLVIQLVNRWKKAGLLLEFIRWYPHFYFLIYFLNLEQFTVIECSWTAWTWIIGGKTGLLHVRVRLILMPILCSVWRLS